MRYLIFGFWVSIFYFVLYYLYSRPGHQPRVVGVVVVALMALLYTIVFKRYLPVLKDMSFPEMAWLLDKLRGVRTPECSVCKSKTDFSIIFEYDVDKRSPNRTKIFCRRDGLSEWKETLERFGGPVLCVEPEPSSDSSVCDSLFLESKGKATKVFFSEDDIATIEKLLARMRETKQKVGWLPKDVLDVEPKPPHYKMKRDVEPEEITVDELVNRVGSILFQIERTFKAGKFWTTIPEPHGEGGIYIWEYQ